MNTHAPIPEIAALESALADLAGAKDDWAQTPDAARIAVLREIRDHVMQVAEGWVDTAGRHKGLPAGSHYLGEEWTSGPYALLTACDALIRTLSAMPGKAFLTPLRKRQTATGQLAVRVLPQDLRERILFSGVTAEVWMEPGITVDTLPDHTATAYDTPADGRRGKVALVLGAGNIASIAPLDVFHKLFNEHQVVILKMNPVNDYLTEYLEAALRPLIRLNALRIVKGGGDVGSYLCTHPLVEEIHITGAAATHDVIVWGPGPEGIANKAAGTPKITKRVTSELGAVCPTIVVPGPWTAADLRFQAEHIATQKLHNSGFNCIACQMLILPKDWSLKDALMGQVREVMRALPPRPAYYPGAEARMSGFAAHGTQAERFDRGAAPACVVVPVDASSDPSFTQTEVFAPALSTHEIGGTDPADYLLRAIRHANEALHGTLGANILIHPDTIQQIGRRRFEEIVGGLRYGAIAINAWTGLAFLIAACPWGAFPGHRLDDVGSGIGFAHNSVMFDRPERTVITGPWRPFPRSILHGRPDFLPRPPWFVTNRRQHVIGRLLTSFQHRPRWFKLPRILLNALRG